MHNMMDRTDIIETSLSFFISKVYDPPFSYIIFQVPEKHDISRTYLFLVFLTGSIFILALSYNEIAVKAFGT